MDFSSVFRTHDFLEDAAISYGFRKKGGVFTLERALPERMDWRRLSLSMAGK